MSEIEQLRAENARLREILAECGIHFGDNLVTPQKKKSFASVEKLKIFSELFSGRSDVFAVRWESKNGKSGYSPSCKNEWNRALCFKPNVKCSDCPNREYLPLNESVIYDHLSGRKTVGIYPMLKDETCRFLAIDFDEQSWRDDVSAFTKTCRELEIPASVEISRSGEGAHIWIFFSDSIAARTARKLGAALISLTCSKNRLLKLSSYDRLFPNQDTMPTGGFGNLIALPLQKMPRACGHSVFVDEDFNPYPDQWEFLSKIGRISKVRIESLLAKIGFSNVVDIKISESEDVKPWARDYEKRELTNIELPEEIAATYSNAIFIEKSALPVPLQNRIVRIASFQNPEFYKAQAMRMNVWNIPRVISCAENFDKYISIPRGCMRELSQLCKNNKISLNVDYRLSEGTKIDVPFNGELHLEQEIAVGEILKRNTGVLCAATAFGKTVAAINVLARRSVSTLILVHRSELLSQWKERLCSFLDISPKQIGTYAGTKKKLSQVVDVAMIQSLSKAENIDEIFDQYGQIIIDECHHLSAFSFESLLKHSRARYILGLTATPVRRDGHQPIIFMQCGDICYRADTNTVLQNPLYVYPRFFGHSKADGIEAIQDIFQSIASDENRNASIISDIKDCIGQGRNILVLSERKDVLENLYSAFSVNTENVFLLHGRIKKKDRLRIFEELNRIPDTRQRTIFATGKLIGEGFDHAILDTLILASPISWSGTLRQYAGRLHRVHKNKRDIRIYDYIESGVPKLERMWQKRLKGYSAMGYSLIESQ